LIRHLQFVENVGNLIAYGFLAISQMLGNFGVGQMLGLIAQDFALSVPP
jgi:hypothetical protein